MEYQYQVAFTADENTEEDPSINNGQMTLEEAQEICREWKVAAILYDTNGDWKKGKIEPDGSYRLT